MDGPVRPFPISASPWTTPRNLPGQIYSSGPSFAGLASLPQSGGALLRNWSRYSTPWHDAGGVCFWPSIQTAPSRIVTVSPGSPTRRWQKTVFGSSGKRKAMTSQRRGLRNLLTIIRSPVCSKCGGFATWQDRRSLLQIIKTGLSAGLDRSSSGVQKAGLPQRGHGASQ